MSNNHTDAMQALRDKNITKVTIMFSGGNDEGGADEAEFVDAQGNKVDVPNSHAYKNQEWLGQGKGYGPERWMVTTWTKEQRETRPANDDEIRWAQVREVLEAPIYAEYGGFGGEFHVHGTLTWDVASGQHEMHGSMSHEVWEDF